MRRCISTALIAVMLVSACAMTSTTPEWVAGTSTQYKSVQFLVGRGQGNTEEQAVDRARAELAKIFQVWVSDESIDRQTIVSSTSGGDQQRDARSEVTRTIASSTDQIVEGIEIKEVWQHPQTKVYYALAVLSRAQAARRLAQRIDQLDRETGEYVNQASREDDLLRKLGALNRAIGTQFERQTVQDTLTIIDRSGQGIAPRWQIRQLQQRLEASLREVRVTSRAGDDPLGGLQTALSAGLAAAGVTVARDNRPDYVVEGELQLDDLGQRDGWQWLRGTLEVTLSEHRNQRVRGTKRWVIKVSAQERPVAERRAMDRVAAILREELRDAIVGFGGGENTVNQ